MTKRTVSGHASNLNHPNVSGDTPLSGGTTGKGRMGPNRVMRGGHFNKPPKVGTVTGHPPVLGGTTSRGPKEGAKPF